MLEGWAGDLYGIPVQSTLDAIRLTGSLEGVIIDPVYEGKSMAGLIDLVTARRHPQGLDRPLRPPRRAARAQRLQRAVHHLTARAARQATAGTSATSSTTASVPPSATDTPSTPRPTTARTAPTTAGAV